MEKQLYILLDDSIRRIFDMIAKQRVIRFKDLRDEASIADETLSENLDKLKAAHLIKEEDAPMEDFKTFYVTEDGLSAERQLRRM